MLVDEGANVVTSTQLNEPRQDAVYKDGGGGLRLLGTDRAAQWLVPLRLRCLIEARNLSMSPPSPCKSANCRSYMCQQAKGGRSYAYIINLSAYFMDTAFMQDLC